MSDAASSLDSLRLAAATLLASAEANRSRVKARTAELDHLIHDARAREHRRAVFNHRDRSCYLLGSAFEPTGGLDLDAVSLAGLLSLGSTAVLMLAQRAIEQPGLTVVDLIRSLFGSTVGREIRAYGVWVRWSWLRDLYVAETETFLASRKGSDPNAGWRTEKATDNQKYLAAEICRDLQLEPLSFRTRGEAHDWIKWHGGNPRFAYEPPKPDLTGLAGLLR